MANTLEELLQRADEALYVAKESGRDCSMIADPESVLGTRRSPDHDDTVDVTMVAQSVA